MDIIIENVANVETSLHREELVRQSQKMESLGQLVGGVAHDFNNILTVITGYCSLLNARPELDSVDKSYVEHICTAAEKASVLTGSLLAFSRKKATILKPVNLNDVVRNLYTFLIRVIGEDIDLKYDCTDADVMIMADVGQLDQVFINLASNARDAMPKGGVLNITTGFQKIDEPLVSRYCGVKPGLYAIITISDTGAGMDTVTQNRLFEPFYTTKPLGKGTGLGMSIVKRIIKQHNSFISVHSEVRQGTSFKIYIPIVHNQGSVHLHDTRTEPFLKGTEMILVVDDDSSIRGVYKDLLTSHGYEVVLANDGKDALEKFKIYGSRAELVLMDMIMPRKNGIKTFKEIQKCRAGVKVLFVSGYSADFIRNRGAYIKGLSLLSKPVNTRELLSKIRNILDGKE